MATIKKFKGGVPPTLQNGEWATNGNYAYLGMPFGEYKVFQGIFDLSESQSVSGFEFDSDRKGFVIKKDTPFSHIVTLINSLPKALKYNDDDATSIDLLFEESPYMDDTGARITFRDFSYTINLLPLSPDSDVVFNIDNAFLVNNSNVNFQDIKFQYPASKGALEIFNSSVTLTQCDFEAKQDAIAGDIVFKDLGLNRIVVVEPAFKMEANDVGSIFNVIESGTTANLVNPTLSDADFAPHTAAGLLKGGIIIIGNADNIKPLGEEALQTSPTSNEHGGIEIRTTFADSISGSVTGLSYNDLADKPNTITQEQAAAIEVNTAKRSYPEADETKLNGIEENATSGADWQTNVANKPTTISEEQATAIEANTAKRSYPEDDALKLDGIEENATAGADWETNIANKPTTITEEQASAIEANTAKRSYPEADETKLEGVEEKATSGADWKTNVANKPTKLSDFENDLEPVQATQVDWGSIQNIPTVLVEFITSLQNDGVTHFEIVEDGTVLRLGHHNS